MFTFAVKKKDDPRTGSVVSSPHFDNTVGVDLGTWVVVMWDDDFSFEVINVTDLVAVPMEGYEQKKAKLSVISSLGNEDETTH